jgi:glycerol-3-phosphate acyltransferase PlsY
MNWTIALFAALVGYLAGSISFSRVVGRFVARGESLDETALEAPADGEKVVLTSVSASSLGARKGSKIGCLTSILDILKAAIPTLAFRFAFSETPYYLLVVPLAVIGHNWPLYHRFKGGRGMSPIIGGMLAVDPLGFIVSMVAGSLISRFLLRFPMGGFSVALPLLIVWFAVRTRDWRFVLFAIAVNAIYWIAVIPDLKQYLAFKREGREDEWMQAMQTSPMGRGQAKFQKYLGALRKKGPKEPQP